MKNQAPATILRESKLNVKTLTRFHRNRQIEWIVNTRNAWKYNINNILHNQSPDVGPAKTFFHYIDKDSEMKWKVIQLHTKAPTV